MTPPAVDKRGRPRRHPLLAPRLTFATRWARLGGGRPAGISGPRRGLAARTGALVLVLLATACGTTVSQGGASSGVPASLASGAEGALGGTPQTGAPPGSRPAVGRSNATSATSGAVTVDSSGADGSTPQAHSPGTNAAITKPLTIGLLGTSAVGGAAGGIGAESNQGVTPSQALQAVAASYQRNGLAGRRFRTVRADIDPSGDYQQQLNAACATFTDDNHVDVVISVDATNDELMSSCLGKARIPRISTGYGSSNAASFVTYPLSRHVGAPNADRRMATVINRSAAAGSITRTSRVGVVVEDCPANRAVYEKTMVPALNRVGVASTAVQFTDCITGFGNAGAASAAMSSAVLSFAARHVDTVMFVSNFEGTLLLFFSHAADSQGFRPRYELTSAAGVAALQGSLPANQVPNMAGWGWLPAGDTSRGATASTSSQRDCIARLARAGMHPASSIDFLAAYAACDGFTALVHGLQGSRGDATSDRLLPALDAVAASIRLSGLVDGRIKLDARRHDGPSRIRAFAYQTGCGCFAYVGASQDMSP